MVCKNGQQRSLNFLNALLKSFRTFINMILMLIQKSYLFLRLVTLRDEVSSCSDHQGGLVLSDDVEQCFIALEQSFLFLQCLCSCIMCLSSLCGFGRVVVLEFQRFHLAVHRLAGSLRQELEWRASWGESRTMGSAVENL